MKNLLNKIFKEDVLQEDSETPGQEARKQRLDKSNKIQTLYEAGFVKDMNAMLAHDRRRVQRYEDEKVFGVKREGPTTDHKTEDEGMMIADDIKHTTIHKSGGLLSTLGAMAIGGGGILLATQLLAKPDPVEKPEPVVTEKEYDYKISAKVIPPRRGEDE